MLGAFVGHAGWRGARALALVALAAALDGATILLLVPVLDAVVGTGSGKAAAMLRTFGLATPNAQLATLVGAFLALALLRLVINFARDMALNALQTGFVESERNRLLTRVAGAPWSRVAELSHTRVTNLLSMEINRISAALQLLLQMTVALVMLVVHTGIALVLAPLLTGALLLVFAGAALMFLLSGVHIGQLGQEVVRTNQAMMASSGTFLQGLKTAMAQNAQSRFLAEYAVVLQRGRSVATAFVRRSATSRMVLGAVSSLLAAATVYLGFAVFHVASILLITLLVIFQRMSGPMVQLFQSGQQMVFALPSFLAVRALGEQLSAHGDAGNAEPPPAGAIMLDRATYRHASGGGISEVTLTIPPGAFVGIAGPSGAGKTTLIDLIVGLIEPQLGSVSVGGRQLDDARRRGWASSIAYVAQEGFLFHDSLRRNLTWNRPDASDADIIAALTLAGATTLVERLDQGLDTVIGERGALLSGGERQRFGLARALLDKPRLLVLDEAANAIDAMSETALLERLATLDPRPTILMISHREASLRFCDMVIRVDAGTVTVEDGLSAAPRSKLAC
jgi:ATP-binding cassette subfamily C protein